MKIIQNYRGIKPAELVIVLEGDGKDVPYQEVKYVVEYRNIAGLVRTVTVGKVVPLTDEERSWFDN